jgi:hypothetical protein
MRGQAPFLSENSETLQAFWHGIKIFICQPGENLSKHANSTANGNELLWLINSYARFAPH